MVTPVAPFVHATVNVPLPSRSAVALATTGSYAPKDSVPAVTMQLTETVAETVRFAVAVAAETEDDETQKAAATARAAAAQTRANRCGLKTLAPFRAC